MNVHKTARYALRAGAMTLGTGAPLAISLAAPATAIAADGQWTAESMLNSAGESDTFDNNKVKKINGEYITGIVNNIASWAIGIAVALFVLRVVMTAVDRMIVGEKVDPRTGRVQSVLSSIPVIGAYPPKDMQGNGYDWKDVWLNFAKQLAICVGAWFLVNLIMGLVSWFMGAAGANG